MLTFLFLVFFACWAISVADDMSNRDLKSLKCGLFNHDYRVVRRTGGITGGTILEECSLCCKQRYKNWSCPL